MVAHEFLCVSRRRGAASPSPSTLSMSSQALPSCQCLYQALPSSQRAILPMLSKVPPSCQCVLRLCRLPSEPSIFSRSSQALPSSQRAIYLCNVFSGSAVFSASPKFAKPAHVSTHSVANPAHVSTHSVGFKTPGTYHNSTTNGGTSTRSRSR